MKVVSDIFIIGGGLAGCEAAWQAAKLGVKVDLYKLGKFCVIISYRIYVCNNFIKIHKTFTL